MRSCLCERHVAQLVRHPLCVFNFLDKNLNRIMRKFITLIIFITIATEVLSQNITTIDTLTYCGIDSISYSLTYMGTTVEGLSGIEYTGNENRYYAISDEPHKDKAHYYIFSIKITSDSFEVYIDSVLFIKKNWVRGEAIRKNPNSGFFYIVDERKGKSFIHKILENGELETIFSADHIYNSGFEGLCFSQDGTKMYVSFERTDNEDNVTKIREYDLNNNSFLDYKYVLDNVPNDIEKDNGITELLTVNDSTLIVIERAYLKEEKRTSVRVYKTRIPGVIENSDLIEKTKFLTSFNDLPNEIKLDNIEGVCFSAGGKELIFISDNNKRRLQQTQFICMKIK